MFASHCPINDLHSDASLRKRIDEAKVLIRSRGCASLLFHIREYISVDMEQCTHRWTAGHIALLMTNRVTSLFNRDEPAHHNWRSNKIFFLGDFSAFDERS